MKIAATFYASALLITSATLLPTSAQAQRLTVPAAPQAAQHLPQHGMSKQQVHEQWGKPLKQHPAIGKPAISRWDYQGMVVVFENNRVLHAVVPEHPKPIHP